MSRSCPAPTRALRQCAQIADLGWPRSVDTIEPDRLHLGPALAAQCTRAHYHVHVAGILVEQRLAEGPRYPARERNPEVVTLTMRVDVFQPPPAPCFYDFKSLSAAPRFRPCRRSTSQGQGLTNRHSDWHDQIAPALPPATDPVGGCCGSLMNGAVCQDWP
jgi:hypothetical protein